MAEQPAGAAATPPARRPRVREVSSRFMSPSLPTNSTPITSDPKPDHRRQTDENLIPNLRSDKPSIPHRKPRSDTPITERLIPSRYRQPPNSIHRSISLDSATKAERLLRQATGNSCPDSPPDVGKWLDSKNRSTTDCARSLNFSSNLKMSISRPPNPKGIRKVSNSNHHEDQSHSLKVLSNRHIQWRVVNAKAEACLRFQKQDAERNLCSLGQKISDIHSNVMKKRVELAHFRGIKTLTTIVEAQTPYLDCWSKLEKDYSDSLIGVTNALLSSSVRFPVGEEVRVDVGELGEALNSALKVVELIGSNIQRFIVKAEEMDVSISELARTVSEEKAQIDECGCMLSKTNSLQVKECSLRGTLMQLHHCCNNVADSEG